MPSEQSNSCLRIRSLRTIHAGESCPNRKSTQPPLARFSRLAFPPMERNDFFSGETGECGLRRRPWQRGGRHSRRSFCAIDGAQCAVQNAHFESRVWRKANRPTQFTTRKELEKGRWMQRASRSVRHAACVTRIARLNQGRAAILREPRGNARAIGVLKRSASRGRTTVCLPRGKPHGSGPTAFQDFGGGFSESFGVFARKGRDA